MSIKEDFATLMCNPFTRAELNIRLKVMPLFRSTFNISKKSKFEWERIIAAIDPCLLWPHYNISRFCRSQTSFDWLMKDDCANYVKTICGQYDDFDQSIVKSTKDFINLPFIKSILTDYEKEVESARKSLEFSEKIKSSIDLSSLGGGVTLYEV